MTIRLNPYDSDPDITIESATSHTFTPDNWFEPYVVTINAGQDEDSVDGYVYIRQEVETQDPFFQNHTPGCRRQGNRVINGRLGEASKLGK